MGGGNFVSGFLGSSDSAGISAVTSLNNGTVAVCGWGVSAHSITAPGWRKTVAGGTDAFVAIFTKSLDTLLAFTTIGGRANDRPTAMTVTPDGWIAVTGWTLSADFPCTQGTAQTQFSAETDGFVAVFPPTLAEPVSWLIPGSGVERPTCIVTDAKGTIYVCGTTTSHSGFPVTNGLFKQLKGNSDGFVIRYTAAGTSVLFGTYLGGSAHDGFTALTVDESGYLYLAGWTSSVDFPMYPIIDSQWWWYYDDRPLDFTYNGGDADATLTVLQPDGSGGVASTYFGGNGADTAIGVLVHDGRIVMSGTTTSDDFPLLDPIQEVLSGTSDIFIAAFTGQGRVLDNSSYWGGDGAEHAIAAARYQGNRMVICGTTTSMNLPGVNAGANTSSAGGTDMLVAVLSPQTAYYVTAIGGTGMDGAASVAVRPDMGFVVAGWSGSTHIRLSDATLTRAPGITGAIPCAIEIQPGVINLAAPSGNEHVCHGSTLRLQWNVQDMFPSDIYEVAWSRDATQWTVINNAISGNSYDWLISQSVGTGPVYIAVQSGRGHRSRTEHPILISEAPRVQSHPESATVCRTDSVTLTVDIVGTGVTLQWQRNGKDVPGATAAEHVVYGSDADGSSYSVRYSSPCGVSGVTTKAIVTQGIETKTTKQQANAEVRIGDPLSLQIQAQGSQLTYRWLHNMIALDSETGPVLSRSSVTAADSGWYRCIAVGECGTDTSVAIHVSILPVSSVHSNPQPGIRLYPNPATDALTIALDPPVTGTVTGYVVNSLGERRTEFVIPEGSYLCTVTLTGLPSGLYAVYLEGTPFLPQVFVKKAAGHVSQP